MEPIIQTQGRRRLPTEAFAASSQISIKVPCDTAVKRMRVTFSGNVVTTFASGTPVADALSTMDNLMNNVSLKVDGSLNLKNVRPYLQQQLQLLTSGVLAERKSSAGAAAASFNNPTADGAFAYGTTTQISTVRESFDLYFECPFVKPEQMAATVLNLQGRSTCELLFSTGAYSALLGFGNTAPVVFSSDDFDIDVTLIENRTVPKEWRGLDYVQSTQSITKSANGTDYREKLPVAQFLAAVALLTRDGAAGSATTATGKVLNSNVIGKVQLSLNGTRTVVDTTFQQLQSDNRAEWGVSSPFASNVSRFDGYAFMTLLKERDMDTALDCSKGNNVDNVELVFDTQAVSFTNPIQVVIETHEFRRQG
jgi:hypothetical protein